MFATHETRSRLGVAAGLLMLLGLAVPILRDEVYAFGDLSVTHLPFRQFYSECLERGERFDWYPDIYCGFYLQGEGQAGLYHPLHWALYRWLPLATAFHLEFLSSYLLLLPGMALFLRRWGVSWDGALIAGLCFTFGGVNLVHFMHLNVVAAIAHIPWLLLTVDGVARAADPRARARWTMLLGAATASQFLLGHPQYLWYSAMAEVAYAALLLGTVPGSWRRLGVLGFGKLCGVLAAGIQLLPTLDGAVRSIRQDPDLAFLAVGSLPPANFLQLIAPYLYRPRVFGPATFIVDHIQPPAATVTDWRAHEFGLYNGALVAVLIAWLVARWRHLEPPARHLAAWCGAMAAVAAVLALGDYSPLFPHLMRIPSFDMFRVSARFVLLIDLATAILAGLAFADLARVATRSESVPWRSLWPVAAVALAAAVTGGGVLMLSSRWPEQLIASSLAPTGQVLAGVVLVGVSATLVTAAARGWRPALGLAILLLVVDLGVYASTFLGHFGTLPLARIHEAFRVPSEDDDARVLACDNRWVLAGHRIVDGNASLIPLRNLDYSVAASRRVAGVGWVVDGGTGELHPAPDPLPRARLVSQAIRSDWPIGDINHIDVATTALLDADPPPLWGVPGRARIVRDRPGNVAIEAESGGDQWLVLSESYHPGWRATVDGRPVRVVATYGDFLGCLVGPGRHDVRFRFEPASIRAGWITTAAGVVLMGLGFVLVRSRRPSPPAPTSAARHRPLGLWRAGGGTDGARAVEEREASQSD